MKAFCTRFSIILSTSGESGGLGRCTTGETIEEFRDPKAAGAGGAGGEISGSRDAIREIGEQPFGRFLMGIVAIGLIGYTAWRWVQASKDTEGVGSNARVRRVSAMTLTISM